MGRLVRKGMRETGTSISVSQTIGANVSRVQLMSAPDVRGQPPIPFNQSLLDHLELVKNETDPWLMFL